MARTKDFDEQEVLKKAIRLFWQKGYNATSMQDLVDHLGISRSSLYDTYGDKHTLYLKALETYQQNSGQSFCSVVRNSSSAKEAVKKLLELITSELLSDTDQKGCFLINAQVEVAAQDAEVNTIVCSHDQQIEDAFFQTIKAGQDSGELRKNQDARALARFIVNAVNGMRVSAKLTKDKQFFDDIVHTTLSVLD